MPIALACLRTGDRESPSAVGSTRTSRILNRPSEPTAQSRTRIRNATAADRASTFRYSWMMMDFEKRKFKCGPNTIVAVPTWPQRPRTPRKDHRSSDPRCPSAPTFRQASAEREQPTTIRLLAIRQPPTGSRPVSYRARPPDSFRARQQPPSPLYEAAACPHPMQGYAVETRPRGVPIFQNLVQMPDKAALIAKMWRLTHATTQLAMMAASIRATPNRTSERSN